MGMRFTNPEPDRFATVVGGRPGGRGGHAVKVSPAVRDFLARLLHEPDARRAFLADPDAMVDGDTTLGPEERRLLRSLPPGKVRALEAMIPAAATQRRAPVLAAAVTALAIFLGLALPAVAQEDLEMAPCGGIRPDADVTRPVDTVDPVDLTVDRPAITKGIRPGPDNFDVTRGIRPDLGLDDAGELLDPVEVDPILGDRPALPQGTSEVVTGTGEVELGPDGGTNPAPPVAKPVVKPPVKIDRPNVTRGIRPTL